MNKLPKIKPIIIVEGKDDAANIKAHLDAELIITSGYGLNASILKRVQYAAETVGIIILTDPDYAGEQIRKKLVRKISGDIKHAYISRDEGDKNGNIGVENASGQVLIDAIKRAKPEYDDDLELYTMQDIYKLGLVGESDSKAKRIAVGNHFRIGYGNAKQILARLNKYKISQEDLQNFLRTIDCDGVL